MRRFLEGVNRQLAPLLRPRQPFWIVWDIDLNLSTFNTRCAYGMQRCLAITVIMIRV